MCDVSAIGTNRYVRFNVVDVAAPDIQTELLSECLSDSKLG